MLGKQKLLLSPLPGVVIAHLMLYNRVGVFPHKHVLECV